MLFTMSSLPLVKENGRYVPCSPNCTYIGLTIILLSLTHDQASKIYFYFFVDLKYSSRSITTNSADNCSLII